MTWHVREKDDVIGGLRSSLTGLSADDARKRLEEYGPNELTEKKRRSPLAMFLDQFKDFMILILIAAAVISGVIGEPWDTLAISVIVVLNAIVGFIQEYRAEEAMAALKKMATPNAVALRDGAPATVPASRLVPGDIVAIDAGGLIPADMRLLDAIHLKIDEAALTGESVPVEKHTRAIEDHSAPLGDRRNMAYKGTFAAYGRGTGVVVTTGMETELGRIASMLQEAEETKTPLQKRLHNFGKVLAIAVLAICAVVFIAAIARGEPPVLMLLTAISLAVAAIPEALPAVVTVSLALGARKMIARNSLIRKLPAVETLGSVTYICSDKTGTLTMNRMTVEELYFDGRPIKAPGPGSRGRAQGAALPTVPYDMLMTALSLNNDSREDSSGNVIGDPTETAPYSFAKRAGFDKTALEKDLPRVAELPFDSERKCMTTFHKWTEPGKEKGMRYISFTKGAPDVLLGRSRHVLASSGLEEVNAGEITKMNEKMASEGLRVIAVGMRLWDDLPARISPETAEDGLTLIGLVGMMDPPREEAKEAIELCKGAGIIPVMITGDHPITARAIARRLGIVGDDHRTIITGRELERLPLEEFEERVDHIRVYARVAPEQKLKIVKALQDRGQVVAMTGDGVNDAPALKRADIGVAMGITGTDVSKEASHMILLDDNFATIVKAVREGRRIYDNIRKFVRYLLTTNSGEIWTLFLAPFAGLPVPLLPIHILWVNLVTDGLPALALSVEPEEKGIMKRPPRRPDEGIFAGGLGVHALWIGLLMAGTILFVQARFLKAGNGHWQTMVFTVMCLSQLGHVLAIRSETESLFTMGLFTNKHLLGAVALTFAMQMATIYVPFLRPIFKTEALTFGELILTIVVSSSVFIAVEMEKLFKRRRQNSGGARLGLQV
jgi:Ca2+-transporting ATPase